MCKRIMVMATFLSLAAVPAFAQDPKAEIGVSFGWSFADGVSGNSVFVPGAGTFNRIDPKDSMIWGIDVGFFIGPNAEVGFLYTNQPTTLEIGGTDTRDVGDMTLSGYHGTYTYNFGEPDANVRPYFMAGLGATTFGGVDYTTVNRTGTTASATRFSSTWGAGVKVGGASKVGGKFGVRWTPAYIKSDADGYWCDPYWGCYVTGDAQYANQLTLDAGVTFKF